MAPKQPPHLIECQTSTAYAQQLNALHDPISIPESEETWDHILYSMLTLVSLVRGNATTWPQETVASVRRISRSLNNAVNSERSRLSGAGIELFTALATATGPSFETIMPLFLPTLLGLCSRPNKVFQSRARQCILAIIEHSYSPSVLPYFAESVKEKSTSLRLAVAECTLSCLNTLNPPDLEKEPRAREIETIIRAAATDASADVRKIGRSIFEAYTLVLPSRVERFTQPLTPTIKKYLNIKPKPLPTRSNPSSRPASAQSATSSDAKLSSPQFSSSTSSLKSSTATSSIQRMPAHGRSASSSNLAGSTTACAANARQRHIPVSKEPVSVPLPRSAAGRTDMPLPSIVPSRSGTRLVIADETGSSRPCGEASGDPSFERLFKSDSTSTRGPSRPTTSATSDRHPDYRPLRTQGTTSGPRRAVTAGSQDGSHDPSSRSRTGPIRPTSSMASMRPSRPDAAEMPHRVVGGARRVPRMPPPELPSATLSDADHGGQAESKAAVPLKFTKASLNADPRCAVANKIAARRGKQDQSKHVPARATENAKPILNAASAQRAGVFHARVASGQERHDKTLPSKRGEQVQSSSRHRAFALAEQSRRNESATGEVDQQATGQPGKEHLPPSPQCSPAPSPSEVPLPPSPQHNPLQLAVPQADVLTGPATPERPRFASVGAVAQTPISALVADIERGFLFTPGDPLSPAQVYADQKGHPLTLPPLRALKTSRLSGIAE